MPTNETTRKTAEEFTFGVEFECFVPNTVNLPRLSYSRPRHIVGTHVDRLVNQATKRLCNDLRNRQYVAQFGSISDKARERAARLSVKISRRCTTDRAQDGDIVIAGNGLKHGAGNVVYVNAHLQSPLHPSADMHICTQAQTPFVNDNAGTEASGGYWVGVKFDELTHVGQKSKLFWSWADLPCANGGIDFSAIVNVWTFVSEKKIY